jgi:protein-L-isoaspartate(D-aspartate) O-methyltransferase
LVVSIEINETTFGFARENLDKTGYGDVMLVHGDGSLGYPEEAPYDAICITAACPAIPQPLVEQLRAPGKLMAPVGGSYSIYGQDLVLLEKDADGETRERILMKVSYVPLTGEYGYGGRPRG